MLSDRWRCFDVWMTYFLVLFMVSMATRSRSLPALSNDERGQCVEIMTHYDITESMLEIGVKDKSSETHAVM